MAEAIPSIEIPPIAANNLYSLLHLSLLSNIQAVEIEDDMVAVVDASGRRRRFGTFGRYLPLMWEMLAVKMRVFYTATSWTVDSLDLFVQLVPFASFCGGFAAATRLCLQLPLHVDMGMTSLRSLAPFPRLSRSISSRLEGREAGRRNSLGARRCLCRLCRASAKFCLPAQSRSVSLSRICVLLMGSRTLLRASWGNTVHLFNLSIARSKIKSLILVLAAS